MERKTKDIFIDGPVPASRISDSIRDHSTKTGIGAHAIFLGQVRADAKPEGIVIAIEYSAFVEMALEKAYEIREAIFTKYELSCMHIWHSLGKVRAGEICLFIFTSAPGRRAAIDACNETVARIKAELPVWGLEVLDNQKQVWKENT
ncbi:MAG: molybdenum cofactor biosynthesis protein MoaE [Prolixibacteraceae bacterium]